MIPRLPPFPAVRWAVAGSGEPPADERPPSLK